MISNRFFLVMAAAAFLLAVSGCGGETDPSQGLFSEELDRVDRMWSRGDLDMAISACRDILKENPKDFGASYRLGIWTLQDDPTRAQEYFEQASAISPEHPGPIFMAGMCRIPFNRFEEADGEMGRAFLMAQKRLGYSLPDTSTEAAQGLTAFREGKFDYAARLFSTSVEQNPDEPALWLMYGKAYLRNGLFDEAEKGFSRALELKPDFPEVHVWRGEMRIVQRRLADARTEVDVALTGNPSLASAHLMSGRLYLEESEFREATKSFWRAVLEDPTVPEAHQRLSDSLFRVSLAKLAPAYLQQLEWASAFLVRYYESPHAPAR